MKFGQYELLERVAVGGMAEVYRGRVAGAEGFEKWVAIKRILPEYARDDRFISMMLTEARIHSALSHRNIVQIHDLGISEDGEYFIVLEYVEGHDLRAVLEAATELGVQVPDSLALHIADELAQALHFAHELTDAEGQPLGIIHRDVSPSNVLISNSGEVKLSDFGIAKRRHDHSFVGSLKGNLVYMSPEQAQRVPLDRRTDVFSLGAVLFEMLTGQKLREITDEVNGFREVASGVIRSVRALRPDLPEAYDALLNRALAANPADRFPDAAAFGAAIRELRRENDAPVGPADMKELVELLNPPRRARSPVERSKVIRLGPEFKVLAGAQRPKSPGDAPALPVPPPPRETPAPPGASSRGRAVPPVVPAALMATESESEFVTGKSTNGNGNANNGPVWAGRVASRLAAGTPNPAFSTSPTPPPPLVPSATAGTNGKVTADPQATPPPPRSGDVATPVAPASIHSRTRPFVSTSPSAPTGSESTESASTNDPATAMLTPAPNPGAFAKHQNPSPFVPLPIPRSPSSGALPAVGWSAPPPLERPASGPHTISGLGPDRISTSFVLPSGAAAMAHSPRRGRWVSVMVVLLLLIVAGAAVVHFKVMPLKVALDWFKPATLSVTSDPDGATVKLDGRELAGKTPLSVEVHRDRVEHTLDLSRPGSKPVRATMRFDRTVPLSQSISLPEEPPPPPPPPVADPEPAPPPPAAAQPVDAEEVGKAARLEAQAQAEAKATEKAAKAPSGDNTGKAAKTGKQSKAKSKKAKAASKAKAAKGGKKAKAAKAEGKPSAEPGGAEF